MSVGSEKFATQDVPKILEAMKAAHDKEDNEARAHLEVLARKINETKLRFEVKTDKSGAVFVRAKAHQDRSDHHQALIRRTRDAPGFAFFDVGDQFVCRQAHAAVHFRPSGR